MDSRYFAYGSNLVLARMRERVPSAHPLGAARLSGMCLTLDKRGSDGSGKANLTPDDAGHVWGVVYALDPEHWPLLDACEPRYERIVVEVVLGDEPVRAHTYTSDWRTDRPVARSWYKQLIVEGARAHALPEAWIRALERLRSD